MSRLVVIEHDGIRNRVFKVVTVEGFNEGLAYRYRNGDGKMDVVYASQGYVPVSAGRVRAIYKVKGNNAAARLVSSDKDCPGEDLSSLVRSHVLGRGYKALYEKKIPWVLVIGIVVVVCVVVGVVLFIRSRGGV